MNTEQKELGALTKHYVNALTRIRGETAHNQAIISALIPRVAIQEAAKWREIDKRERDGRVSPKAVMHVTSEYFQVGIKDMTGKGRVRYVTRARHISIYVIRELCVCRDCGVWKTISFQQISNYFDRKLHTYAFHAKVIVTRRMKTDEKYKQDVNNIMSLLGR